MPDIHAELAEACERVGIDAHTTINWCCGVNRCELSADDQLLDVCPHCQRKVSHIRTPRPRAELLRELEGWLWKQAGPHRRLSLSIFRLWDETWIVHWYSFGEMTTIGDAEARPEQEARINAAIAAIKKLKGK